MTALFRVTADWADGGFAVTKPFESLEAALAWGRERAPAGAVVSAVCRKTDQELVGMFAGDLEEPNHG